MKPDFLHLVAATSSSVWRQRIWQFSAEPEHA
jgi:hypothetical protein